MTTVQKTDYKISRATLVSTLDDALEHAAEIEADAGIDDAVKVKKLVEMIRYIRGWMTA